MLQLVSITMNPIHSYRRTCWILLLLLPSMQAFAPQPQHHIPTYLSSSRADQLAAAEAALERLQQAEWENAKALEALRIETELKLRHLAQEAEMAALELELETLRKHEAEKAELKRELSRAQFEKQRWVPDEKDRVPGKLYIGVNASVLMPKNRRPRRKPQ